MLQTDRSIQCAGFLGTVCHGVSPSRLKTCCWNGLVSVSCSNRRTCFPVAARQVLLHRVPSALSRVRRLCTGQPSSVVLGALFRAGALGRLGRGHRVAGPAGRVEVVVLEEDGRQGGAQMVFDVVGEHAQEDVRAHVHVLAMPDGPHAQVDAFQAAEGLRDVPETLVGAHDVGGAHGVSAFAGADDVDAVERGLAGDGGVVAFDAQPRVRVVDPQFLRQRRRVPHPRGGQLRTRVQ